jgi:hypothetical protein
LSYVYGKEQWKGESHEPTNIIEYGYVEYECNSADDTNASTGFMAGSGKA